MGNLGLSPFNQTANDNKISQNSMMDTRCVKHNATFNEKTFLDSVLHDISHKYSDNFDDLYDKRIIVLSTFNTIVKVNFVDILKHHNPLAIFTRPKLAIPGKEYEYKKTYIPFPSVTELETFHIDEINQFYNSYRNFPIFIGIYDDPNKNIEQRINSLLPSDSNVSIFHVNKKDVNLYKCISIDFTARLLGLPEASIIINSDSLMTTISYRDFQTWKTIDLNQGYSGMIKIFQQKYDAEGEDLSIVEKMTFLESNIIEKINNIDSFMKFDIFDDYIFPNIIITGSLAETLTYYKVPKNAKSTDIIEYIVDQIQIDCWQQETPGNMYKFYYNFSNLILTLELLKYITCNFVKNIKISYKPCVKHNNVNLCDNWCMGKVLADNNIYKI